MFFCARPASTIDNTQITSCTSVTTEISELCNGTNKQNLKPDYMFCFKTSLRKYSESLLNPSKLNTCHVLLAQTISLAQIAGTKHDVLCTQETRHSGAPQCRASWSLYLFIPLPSSRDTDRNRQCQRALSATGFKLEIRTSFVHSYMTIFWPAVVDPWRTSIIPHVIADCQSSRVIKSTFQWWPHKNFLLHTHQLPFYE